MMAVADPQSVAGAAVGLAGTIPHQGARTITDGFPGRAETVTLRRPKWPDGLGRFPKPSSASGYFDVIRFWLKSPLDSREGSKLRNLCGGEVRADREPAPFPGGYQERITMRQPLDSALKWLAERDDVHINYAEIALDWTFESSASRDNGWQFIGYHLVRRHHGKKQEVRLGCSDDQNDWTPQHDIELAQTRYDGPRSARNLIVLYKQEVSRKTGEIPLLHLEWRANGAQAVRSLGIVTPADLIQFDYRRFWQHRLLLLDASPGRLGRFIRNCTTGQKSRIETPADLLLGNETLEQYTTIQELIDGLGPRYRIRRALTKIPNDFFLPESGGVFISNIPARNAHSRK